MFTLLALLMGVTVSAQSADKLYEQGKALYDAEKYKEAVPKLRQAAEKGHKKAQYRLGRCYDKGRGVKEDNTTAYQWYLKSANQDYAKAQYQLGRCYLKGKGTTADAAKAKTWLKKAVKNPKKGDEVLQELKDDAAKGDEEAKRILTIIGK
jgi:TPR repeat protein